MALPKHAQVVIVGGGIIGVSIAYHLTKLGWRDVVLLERGQLTCGTTWHAAGLVMQLRTTHTMTELCRYGTRLFDELKSETGQDTGFRRTGSLPIARNADRLVEISRLVSLGKSFGVEAHMLSAREVKEHYPLLDDTHIVGGAFIPGDGQTNPVDSTQALAKGARAGGANIFENVSVTGFEIEQGKIKGVVTDHGTVNCEVAVLCAGAWSRDLGRLAGVNVPLYAAEHMYVTTEADPAIPKDLPVLRDTDGYLYIKEDAGKLLVGAFEPHAKPLPMEKLPNRFEFGELPEDWAQFELPMSKAIQVVPLLQSLGIRHFMNGPESFTPDNKFILGEAPEVKGFYVAAGFNSQGILSAAGVGKALSEWIVNGEPTMDLSEVDIARFHKFQGNRKYLHERISESLGLLYAMHWPHRQFETARPVRETPLFARLKARNAVFGTAAGWERANWFAPEGSRPEYVYSYGRQNWFDVVGEEHCAAREAVALFDLSSFGKTFIEGPDAEAELQRICANDMAVATNKVVYTQMLNSRGGIVADVTFTRLSEDRYMMVTAAAAQAQDLSWVRRNLRVGARVTVTDVTSGFAVLSVMGPRARRHLEAVSTADFSNDAFPFGTAQEIEIGYAKAHALRVTYVGELGWELYLPTEFAGPAFDLLVKEGEPLGMRLAGYHALDSLRSEKGYRHFGHDVTPGDTPLEAGLSFAVSFRKADHFIGRAALEKQQAEGLKRRIVFLRMESSEPILLHDEPILRDGRIVGRTTSAAFGYTLGSSVAQGYVTLPDSDWKSWLSQGSFEVELAGVRHKAICQARPFYDPDNARIRL
ncbi:4-methylaminobutanoate oxidase (formaldehyde-forming) [Mesorhizobium sp. YL-MeA3-2017]|uniref:GcvT family protein n=1 Tax=Mesorhizobium sp. YL-MeA3-2017 TaxID=3042284 RepID=UPI0015CBA156|nr:FAD-dependent oxidoreductase [Mesorhizobium sp. YL-MeA3-2017]MDQ0332959.1 4-methylaminobutanoate oxidase (formaldehyde-forming) [Mesorhizobium sp. YL-MeA3-2017]